MYSNKLVYILYSTFLINQLANSKYAADSETIANDCSVQYCSERDTELLKELRRFHIISEFTGTKTSARGILERIGNEPDFRRELISRHKGNTSLAEAVLKAGGDSNYRVIMAKMYETMTSDLFPVL